MQIFVDADACPVVRIVEEIAEKYHIRTTLLCDTNHVLNSDYSEVIVVGAGADAVDYSIFFINAAKLIVNLPSSRTVSMQSLSS